MKKALPIILILIAILVPLAVAVWWYAAESEKNAALPAVQAQVGGVTLSPDSWTWYEPVYFGLSYKEFTGEDAAARATIDPATLTAGATAGPDGYDTTAELTQGGSLLYDGAAADFAFDAAGAEAGEYQLTLYSRREGESGRGYGIFTFTAGFLVQPAAPAEEEDPELPEADEPTLDIGRTELQQGDIFSMRLRGLPEGVQPTAETSLGLAVFTPGPSGSWSAAVPVGNLRQPGDYPVTVYAGDERFEATVTVLPFAFEEQDLIIDVTDPVISEANSPAAYQQYREKIPPLFDTYDDVRYWEGVFLQPVEGVITTEFGMIRYTNGDYANPSHHWGMDISAAEGTPVAAPGAGRVVLAENLLNTGNTLVIEHGGGLKSYYFHMHRLDVAEGEQVEKGQLLGQVGTTGYSTGPHLHFEMRISNQAISPSMLFSEEAGLYSLSQE